MDLLANPFHILNATLRDNSRRIIDIAEERSLLMDPDSCSQARSNLTNPRKRLSAEMAWLPGLAPNRISECLALLEHADRRILEMSQLCPISRANLLAAGLSRLKGGSPELVAEWVIEISEAFEEIDPEDVCDLVNEERTASGFSPVSVTMVEEAIQERQIYYNQVIKSALDSLPSRDLVKAITIAAEETTYDGEETAPVLIGNLVDTYEVEAQQFLDLAAKNIDSVVNAIKTLADAKQPIDKMVSQLIDIVKNWDSVAQPIQVITKSHGRKHDESHRIAGMVRELAVDLHNNHGKTDLSLRLTNMLQEVFAEVGEVVEQTEADADALQDIIKQREHYIQEAKEREAHWKREITYEAEMGTIFKNKLYISPEGIQWKGRRWKLESITRTRWGGTRHYVNGIPTGTTYKIAFGNDEDLCSIELKQQAIFDNFIERLWKAVGVRLLTEYLEGLRDGKIYQFGSMSIQDRGVTLVRRRLFAGNESIFCRWNELQIWNASGAFCIGRKDDKKLAESLPYQEMDNVHVLEAMIRTFWQRATDRISSLLKGE